MRRLILTAVLASAAALIPAAALAGEREQAAVRAREAALYQAFLHSDAKAMDEILAPDFAYQHGSGVTFTEAQFLELIGGRAAIVTRADTPEMTFRDFGKVIVTYGQGPVEGRMGDQPFGGVLRFVNVWKRDGRDWRLHHRNSEFLPPAVR